MGSIKVLTQMANAVNTPEEASILLDEIAVLINKEMEAEAGQINQVVLNLGFRTHYQLLHKYQLPDKHFAWLVSADRLTHRSEKGFQLLYAMLLTEQSRQVERQHLLELSLQAFVSAVEDNCELPLLAILKALNLLCKKFAELRPIASLEHIYHCLQSNQIGMREETLVLFHCCCQRQPQYAVKHFQLVMEFWPWTNRNKFYLLSVILQTQCLENLLAAGGYCMTQFFEGLRLSLCYKSLLAASQYLVKSLSGQQSKPLLHLAVEILTRGSLKEMQNFRAQWFLRIIQQDELFLLLQQQPEIARFLGDSATTPAADNTENYRLILVFSMFARHIFHASKLHFFKISTELITNCSLFECEAQLLIYRFIVDNLASFAIEDCLEFLVAFIRQHRGVENAQARNGILSQMPTIINYIAKTFSRLQPTAAVGATTLEASIEHFFLQLQELIAADIAGTGETTTYQPKIFALKLLEILLKSLYAPELQKNAKNCSVVQNQHLGQFLRAKQVFNGAQVCEQLLRLLDDPLGYDDAMDLVVTLLQLLKFKGFQESLELCKNFCQRSDVDECALSGRYGRVAMHSLEAASLAVESGKETQQFYDFAHNALVTALSAFTNDPLLSCKRERHLFGYINVINEMALAQPHLFMRHFDTLIQLLQNILNVVLDKLNLANLRANQKVATAASFQDMDESLQLLVLESSFVAAEAEHEQLRKFLLMSFWLTLKACCDLATTMGCILVPTSDCQAEHLVALERCLDVNVAVLTRCRHKGAIEAAGSSVGKLSRCITSKLPPNGQSYKLLHNCLELLLTTEEGQQVSTTRRGAGFSLMFLHIIKNEEPRNHPLLTKAVVTILERMQTIASASCASSVTSSNCDRSEALLLHYLCVLVKDTELRDAMSAYHNEIMMAAILQIDNADWTVCNAALQLFGALTPKIVGQRQATEYEEPPAWEPSEITYSEVSRRLPKICEYILNYCAAASSSTRSLILFLSFLAKVEHLRKSDASDDQLLLRFRELMWTLLRHACEKVRQLAATCFVRAHEFRCDLPSALLQVTGVLFEVEDENFFEGLVFVLHTGVLKMQHESKHTLDGHALGEGLLGLRKSLVLNFRKKAFKLYTLCKLLDLFILLGCNAKSPAVAELMRLQPEHQAIGYDVWQQRVAAVPQ